MAEVIEDGHNGDEQSGQLLRHGHDIINVKLLLEILCFAILNAVETIKGI
jgi:hypothetical protein